MIDRNPKLPVVQQCSLFALARSTAYYTPREIPAEDLALMRRIDEWPLDHPFAGTRLLRDLLRPEGFQGAQTHRHSDGAYGDRGSLSRQDSTDESGFSVQTNGGISHGLTRGTRRLQFP